MLNYQEILNDKIITDIYNSVDDNDEFKWCTHGLGHIYTCINTIKKIYEICNLPTDTLPNCLIACALHDVGMLGGKPGHQERSLKFAKDYLKHKKLSLKNKRQILRAIGHHSEIRKQADIVERVLVLADKLDISSSRILEAGEQICGMRQIKYIKEVTFAKTDTNFEVNFIVCEEFDLDEWQAYYFANKIYTSIKNFATALKLNYKYSYIKKTD